VTSLLRTALAASVMCLAIAPAAGHAEGDRLSLIVSPVFSIAPASVVVRAIVEHDPDNRQLQFVADSPDFYRSSVRVLDGERAPRISEMRLNNIPAGAYEVTVTLYDVDGECAVAHRSIEVLRNAPAAP
jgi:hypothetical protein